MNRDVPVPTRDAAEYQLAEMLSGWRSEIVSTPEPELLSVDDVERAIGTSERASRGRRMVRHLRVVSGAAAIVIVAAAGLTVLSEGSQPGDPLWGIKQVVFAEAASQTQAAHDVRNNLERAEAAGGILHVSLDVDFLDPSIAPAVGTTVPGGPTYREAQLCMEMIADTGRMALVADTAECVEAAERIVQFIQSRTA